MPAAIAALLMVGLLAAPMFLYGALTLFGVLIGQGIPIFMLWEFWFILPMAMLVDFSAFGGVIIAFITWILLFLIFGYGWGFPAGSHMEVLIKAFFEHPFVVHKTAIQFDVGNQWFLNPGPRFVWAPTHFIQMWPFFNALDLIIMSMFYFIIISLVLRFCIEKPIAALIARALGLKRFEPEVECDGSSETVTNESEAMAT